MIEFFFFVALIMNQQRTTFMFHLWRVLLSSFTYINEWVMGQMCKNGEDNQTRWFFIFIFHFHFHFHSYETSFQVSIDLPTYEEAMALQLNPSLLPDSWIQRESFYLKSGLPTTSYRSRIYEMTNADDGRRRSSIPFVLTPDVACETPLPGATIFIDEDILSQPRQTPSGRRMSQTSEPRRGSRATPEMDRRRISLSRSRSTFASIPEVHHPDPPPLSLTASPDPTPPLPDSPSVHQTTPPPLDSPSVQHSFPHAHSATAATFHPTIATENRPHTSYLVRSYSSASFESEISSFDSDSDWDSSDDDRNVIDDIPTIEDIEAPLNESSDSRHSVRQSSIQRLPNVHLVEEGNIQSPQRIPELDGSLVTLNGLRDRRPSMIFMEETWSLEDLDLTEDLENVEDVEGARSVHVRARTAGP